MRTTLNIDGDVLIAAKELARRERKTAGEIRAQRDLYGFKPIPARGDVVTKRCSTETADEFRGRA